MPEKGDEKRKRCQVTEMSREKKRSRDSDGLDKKMIRQRDAERQNCQEGTCPKNENSTDRNVPGKNWHEKEMPRERDVKKKR